MSIESFLKDIVKIDRAGTYAEDGSYVIDFDTSEDFGVVYSKLDRNDELEYLDENSLLTIHNASLLYKYSDIYQINLIADFDNDEYKIVVNEL